MDAIVDVKMNIVIVMMTVLVVIVTVIVMNHVHVDVKKVMNALAMEIADAQMEKNVHVEMIVIAEMTAIVQMVENALVVMIVIAEKMNMNAVDIVTMENMNVIVIMNSRGEEVNENIR